MAESKIYPPSESRIAEARRAGLAPRPVLSALTCAACVLALHARLFGAAFEAQLRALFQQPLQALAAQAEPWAPARRALWQLALHGLGFGLTSVLTAGLLLWLVQGPQLAWPSARARRFAAPKPGRAAPLLLAVFAVVLFFAQLRDALWLSPTAASGWVSGLLGWLAALLVALSLIDVSLARAAFFRALFMTRRERNQELREAYGAPEVRSARDRVRREQAGKVR